MTDMVAPVMEQVLECAAAVLEPPVARSSLYSGATVAFDDCCDGQVWVRLVSLTPVLVQDRAQTGRTTTAPGCGVIGWVALLAVGALRCAAVVDDAGHAPAPAVLTAETQQMTADAFALAEALTCCAVDVTPQRWDPIGPEGGCVGGEWTVAVRLDACPCP
jgi:hypothetical protein